MVVLMVGTVAGAARAQSTMTVLGSTDFAACGAAAAQALRDGVGSAFQVGVCSQAIGAAGATRGDVAVAYVNRSVIRLMRAEVQAALDDAGAAVRLNGGLAEAYVDRGVALSAAHHPAEAIRDFGMALGLHPRRPEVVLFDRGSAEEDVGDVKAAYLDYRQAAEVNPGWANPRIELARFKIGQASTAGF
jgi:tetratricopeptide (TPR) repeat protein